MTPGFSPPTSSRALGESPWSTVATLARAAPLRRREPAVIVNQLCLSNCISGFS
jgi:hypothetical protein